MSSLPAKCLIMSDLHVPHSGVRGKTDLHNNGPKKRKENTNGPILLSSSRSFYLCCSLSSCSLSLSFRHPSFISILCLTAAWWVITPHSDERSGAYEGLLFFFHPCVLACLCVHIPRMLVIRWPLLKWYGRQRGVVRWSNQPATR